MYYVTREKGEWVRVLSEERFWSKRKRSISFLNSRLLKQQKQNCRLNFEKKFWLAILSLKSVTFENKSWHFSYALANEKLVTKIHIPFICLTHHTKMFFLSSPISYLKADRKQWTIVNRLKSSNAGQNFCPGKKTELDLLLKVYLAWIQLYSARYI